jgi:hypothetical protein
MDPFVLLLCCKEAYFDIRSAKRYPQPLFFVREWPDQKKTTRTDPGGPRPHVKAPARAFSTPYSRPSSPTTEEDRVSISTSARPAKCLQQSSSSPSRLDPKSASVSSICSLSKQTLNGKDHEGPNDELYEKCNPRQPSRSRPGLPRRSHSEFAADRFLKNFPVSDSSSVSGSISPTSLSPT